MPTPLSVLIVEDMESDAQILVRLLKKADYELVYEQVETAGQMRAALEKRTWDIIISDYNLPQFDGQSALAILKEAGLDIPFIVVSGKIGEETAVAMMRAGAQDYLIKDNLTRFVPAVKRELAQAELRKTRKQAEVALRESEDRYRTLVEFSPDSICIHCAGKIVYANAATVKLLHANSAEEIIGMPAIQFVHPDYQDIVVERIRRSYENRQPASLMEEKFITLDGKTIEVEVTTVPIMYDGKAATQLVIRDITERKQAEEALVESETKFRWLYEYAPMAYHLLTPDGSITDVNHRWCELLGYFREEVIGRSIFDFVDDEEKDTAKASFEKKKLSNQPFVEGSQRNFLTKGGEVKIFKTYDYFVLDQEQNIKSVQTTIEDITERVQAEEALRISEERYRGLFNSMIDGFALHEIICDENEKPVDYRFLEVNPAFERLTGLQSTNLIGRTVLEVLPDTEHYWIEVYGNVALTGNSAFYENYSHELGRYLEVSAYCPRLGQFAIIVEDITERKQAEQDIHQHVTELEMLYQSGLALSQLLNPKEVGQKILELLGEKLNWHHTRIRLYHPQDDTLELLDFNQPGLKNDLKRNELLERVQNLVLHSGQGMSGWVIQQGQPLRSGDVRNDPRYVEAYSAIRSGLYVPMKVGERIVGVISVESEQPDAFSEADERLIVTLANQAASAFENARLFEETHQRVMELETINRISFALRTVSKQDELLSIVLDEALSILNTLHGSIELYNQITDTLDQTILRGWIAKITAPHPVSEGIAGKVFISGEIYISRDFANDPETRAAALREIPPGWGGICLPIRTAQKTLGVMIVSVPSERELNKDEVRLLATLSEMTGAALQRMQLHEQTIRHLDQLNALRTVDQAIASSRDIQLTLNILLTHAISQLGADAADVLLFQPGLNQLEAVAGHGFHTHMIERVSLSDSFAGRAIMEHRTLKVLDFETARQNLDFGKFWKEEGFACFWCVPLFVKGEVKGVLEIYRRTPFTPDAEWLEFLEALAGQAAITIDNTQLFEYLQRANLDLNLAYDATIEGWSRAMDMRDHETEGHTLRVTELTLKLARAMNVSESQLTAIRRGALLHDIGKMGIPDSILLKDGELTDEEWQMMRKHPELALKMLAPIGYLNDALDIPYCHHEKWDGTGYPQGLKGDRIPLIARNFAVVDVWDALTSNRIYRKRWTKQKARQYIKEQSGKHFDPQVVDVFLKIIK